AHLSRFARRVYSESGEDGILERLFGQLGVEQGFFVEFGAWDGRRLSNTRLLAERGWGGLLIEADDSHFAELGRNLVGDRVKALHARVGLGGENALEAILDRHGCPEHFDLLSIDVDSDDLAIWLTLRRRRPTCVVIEYNVTIPFDIDFINPPGRNWGNSARTIERCARAKGYRLVAMTGMNLIFADREAAERSKVAEITLEAARLESGERLFWGYDGSLIRWRPGGRASAPEFLTVPFHQYVYPQPMPRFLRRWQLGKPRRGTERFLSLLSAMARRPLSFVRARLAGRRSAGQPSKGS
ncbi:MAG TPA: hypothetical protein VF652_04755, partial [Allosphingosinicella sp.]